MTGIIDLHCDTLVECYLGKSGLRSWEGHLNLEKMLASGGAAQCFAVFTATGEAAARMGVTLEPYEMFQEVYAFYIQQLSANCDLIAPACNAWELEENQKRGKLSAILTLEDCIMLEGKLERVDLLADMGVAMAGLTWNYENSVGYPNSSCPEKHGMGLLPFGIEAVRRMNEKGIIVDVSHLSQGGFYDVARHSGKPFVASHSCARELCGHSRNLDRRQLRMIGEKGGVVGVNFCAAFLEEGSQVTKNRQIAEHAAFIADQAGMEAVALGSDFDGIQCGLEMVDYTGYSRLIEELQRHFTDDQIDGICSGNFLRVFRECAGQRTSRLSALLEDQKYQNPVLEI